MPIHFETHRNCITNDLFTTVQLLDEFPEMRMAAELSHYVVDRASRSRIQVALGFPQHEKWVQLFQGWWKRGFELRRSRHEHATLAFVCELGPPDYAITDANGREMSDRWGESLQLMQWARAIWTQSDSESHIAPTSGK
jgi:hypothetical protein